MCPEQPPSFAPRGQRPRPNSAGAKRVRRVHEESASKDMPSFTSPHQEHPNTVKRRSLYRDQRARSGQNSDPRPASPPLTHSNCEAVASTPPPSYPPRRRGAENIRAASAVSPSVRGAQPGRGQQPPARSYPPAWQAGTPKPEQINSPQGRRTHATAPRPVDLSEGRIQTNQRARGAKPKSLPWGKRMVAFAIVLVLGWPLFLLGRASSKIEHVDALSDAAATAGTTYLIAGSDKRSHDSPIQDETEGERADTIMVLHRASNGQSVLISIPRDTWVDISQVGENKINAAYSLGGPPLLVETVEHLTGLHIDHYVEVGMGGVTEIVDALGTVELCLDYDVSDPKSELEWEAGCHQADGSTALAFSRMRYSDPEGDIGRARRQRQVINSTLKTAFSPATFVFPWRQLSLANSAAGAVVTDHHTGAFDLGLMAWTLRSATNTGMTGTPPIARTDLETYSGVAVELDEEAAPLFFEKLRNGTLTSADLKPPQ